MCFVGILLVQAAWALVVPPFRGLDEHEHVFKAAAVARGDWTPFHETSRTGWGELVEVPRDLAVAAKPVCDALPVTSCDPEPSTQDGMVVVPSSAARYNPLFYVVPGTVARPFSGDVALFVMRGTAAAMCALLLAAAFVTTRRWSRTPWPSVALIVACTPVLMYSTSVMAPNGVEMAAAALVWAALMGLVVDPSPQGSRHFLALATIGAVPLVTVRTLGPLWLVLILVVAACFAPKHWGRTTLRNTRARWSLGLVAGTAALAAAYSMWAGTNAIPSPEKGNGPADVALLVKGWFLWILQSAGAFPARDEPAPALLYGIVITGWLVLIGIAWRRAVRRQQLAFLLLALIATVLPIAITVTSYDAVGVVWQGRYGLPLTMGFAILCGVILDQAGQAPSPQDRALPRHVPSGQVGLMVAGIVFFGGQIVGMLAVLSRLQGSNVLPPGASWFHPAVWLVVGVAAAGTVLLVRAQWGRPATPGAVQPLPTDGDQARQSTRA